MLDRYSQAYSLALANALEAQVALDKARNGNRRYARLLARSVVADNALDKARNRMLDRILPPAS